jgi:hypothetical protein
MPRYFFNLRDGEFIKDAKGLELSGPDEAQREAERLAEIVAKFFPQSAASVIVTDDSANVVVECRIESKRA